MFQRDGACMKEKTKVKSVHWSLPILLPVDIGVAMATLGSGSRMVVGQDSGTSFLQQAGGLAVSLNCDRTGTVQTPAAATFVTRM